MNRLTAPASAPAAREAVPFPAPPRPPGPLRTSLGRIRDFQPVDWAVYLAWVGVMAGLAVASGAFLAAGSRAGAWFPAEAYLLPVGAGVFTVAIAVDTIGHRTVYKEILRGGEALVHHVTIATGVGACVLLIAAYPQRRSVALVAGVLTALSFLYSLVDEAMHWRRYLTRQSDVVEMWSHVFILIGHGTLMAGWWRWYLLGYPGVKTTLAVLGLAS
jgi:hypothetical protein